MALLSLRKFAKMNGISTATAQKLIEEGVISKDRSGMIDSKESIRIYRDKLRRSINHYTMFLVINACKGTIEDDIRKLMSNENAVEVSCFDDICVKFNEALQEKAADMSGLVNKKYKEKILAEFIKRYKECIKSQLYSAVCDETVKKLPADALFELLAYGTFPEGYEHLKNESVSSYVKVCTERSLIKYNNVMQEKFDRICDDLALYWNATGSKVFERSSIDSNFFEDIRQSILHKEIVNSPEEFKTGKDPENCTEVFQDLKSSCKSSFQTGVLAEYAKKRFYRIITIDNDMSREECLRLMTELRTSGCNEILICTTKDLAQKYMPDTLMTYLDSLQLDRMDNVVYIGDMEEPFSGVVIASAEPTEAAAEIQEAVLDAETKTDDSVNGGEADNSIQS